MPSLSLASPATRAALSRACQRIATTQTTTAAKRSFSSLPSIRPSILPTNSTVFRPCNSSGSSLLSRLPTTSPVGITSAAEGVVDIVPKSSITAHPALAGPQQIRCGPRPTMARSSRLVRKRRHGFLSRIRTRTGRKMLQRRKDKKRVMLGL